MAAPKRPGRALVLFFSSLAILYGLVAIAGTWVPSLGLDLQGGTRITLIAKGVGVTQANLTEAADIIDSRVNGSGVSEAKVAVQGDRYIVVEIPGQTRRDLVETVKRQAQLRFRVVARTGAGAAPVQPETPGKGVLAPTPSAQATVVPTVAPSPEPSAAATAKQKGAQNRPGLSWAKGGAKAATPSPAPAPTEPPAPAPQPPGAPAPATGSPDSDPLVWMNNPDPKSVAAFDTFTCPAPGVAPQVDDNPKKPLITCDASGQKYLLSKAMIEGTQLDTARAAAPDTQNTQWRVTLDFDGPGTEEFAKISRALVGTEKQFAIVLDGQVISAPTMDTFIGNGRAEISGSFDQESATSLAASLRYGALPITFDDAATTVETVGPSLAGNQLSAGLWAGGIGLFLVMLYCLIYYRGLGLVVISSLIFAAAATYALVLLLSGLAGFTLTLPGIAGLIVAVGITADSFVVFFERIRDEMRDGLSMRGAVEAGWIRARSTCLAADAVSLLAAVVLYIFAAGVVKGFAFALGLSTVIDLAILFFFTKPMVSWLARYPFFSKGHKMSGLDAEALGLAGGKA